ncbi:MAG: arabinose efflux permease family protein [Caproiciproducens sp.]|jgi:MFS family permease|nr:arabinose efflux permease family protein [Caproiciproducens sp.]
MKNSKQEKLWTPSFFILWQSQLISTMGDAVYSIALGFWVLAVTGSTALMGTLMAASTLPGVLISPFAGVLIDRCNKKRVFILMDAIRGIITVLLAAAAYRGLIAIWMVFVVGILLSICGAVFGPGVQSTIPDLVPKSKMANANSMFSIVSAGSNMIGSVAGGFLFQTLGAPVLFLFDGLSFLFSGMSLPFVKIPKNIQNEKTHFFKDMADGFRYMWCQTGLRIILIIAALSNFFSFIGIVLFLPLCQATPSLGAGKYGVMMACFMAGAMAGFLFLSIVSVKPANKLKIFMAANAISNLSIIIAINQPFFIMIALFLALAGFFNSVVNVLLISTVQVSTPQEVRGKVMSFITMTTQGLTPFAMALGGILGGFLPIRTVITAAFLAVFLITIPSYFAKSFRKYITTDYGQKETPELAQENDCITKI